MSLQKQIEIISQELFMLNQRCEEYSILDAQVSKSIAYAMAKKNPKLEQDLAVLDKQVVEFKAIMRSAAKYATSSPSLKIPSQVPNIPTLLIMQSDLDRSGLNSDDKARLANDVLEKAQSYINYIQNKKESLIADEESRREKDAEELRQKKVFEQKRIQEDTERIEKLLNESSIPQGYQAIEREFGTPSPEQALWGEAVGKQEKLLLGYKGLSIIAPDSLTKTINKVFGPRYSEESQTVDCPYGCMPRKVNYLSVEYTARNEGFMKKGIQALIMNIFRYYPLGQYRVSVIDSVHYNADLLGGLSASISTKNSLIEPVPEDEKAIKNTLSILTDQYRGIQARIGTQTVEEYNSTNNEDAIPFRLLIINSAGKLDASRERESLSFLISNSSKFGIFPVILEKNDKGGTFGTDAVKKLPRTAQGQIRIISDNEGDFYIDEEDEGANRWQRFVWLSAPKISYDFIKWIREAIQEKKRETSFYKLYFTDENGELKKKLPERSRGGRRRIDLPFAVDEEGHFQSCEFEDDQFAAYMMGASGSGKSTLLHTLISSLITNYHPDELELWLADYKMTEFSLYIKNCPPHVKYVLLENSEDLTFDIIDKLTDLLNRRKFIFAKNGWSKLTDVPQDVYMPAIFVIIDEFSIMSQIINRTNGSVPDYTLKLQNLLAQGRALGMKFLFASQTYSGGITGLTATARKQIQMRIALKNTPDEIKETLVLASDDITSSLRRDILSLPKYESLFKFRNADGELQVGRLKNMYLKMDELKRIIYTLNESMKAVEKYDPSQSYCYVNKHPVLIDGGTPKTWDDQKDFYCEYDRRDTDRFPGDIGVYPGVPCSFQLANHFMLCEQFDENILLIGGNMAQQISALLSTIKSFKIGANNGDVEAEVQILAHHRSRMLRTYQRQIENEYTVLSNIERIGSFLSRIRAEIEKTESNCSEISEKRHLIGILGFENIVNEMERLAKLRGVKREKLQVQPEFESPAIFLAYLKKKQQEMDADTFVVFKERKKAEFIAYCEQYNGVDLREAQEDLMWLLNNASQYGVHFLLCFNTAQDFLKLRISPRVFRHKLMFAIPKDDAYAIAGGRRASAIDEDVMMYQGDTHVYTMRPHLHASIPVNGWSIDENGYAIQKEELM